MQKLVSPIELGDTACTGILARVPIVRQIVFGTEWQRYFGSIRRQIMARGPVPDTAWVFEDRCRAARRIEVILKESCWGDDFTFHPDDPYRVVGEWEAGDLSEVEVLAEIGKEFGVHIGQDVIACLIEDGLTFGGFVDYVLKLRKAKGGQAFTSLIRVNPEKPPTEGETPRMAVLGEAGTSPAEKKSP